MIEMPFSVLSLLLLMKKVRVVACHVLNNFQAEGERDVEVNPEFWKMTVLSGNAICSQWIVNVDNLLRPEIALM